MFLWFRKGSLAPMNDQSVFVPRYYENYVLSFKQIEKEIVEIELEKEIKYILALQYIKMVPIIRISLNRISVKAESDQTSKCADIKRQLY